MTETTAISMDDQDERRRRALGRILNHLTVAKASAQLLERRAATLPDHERAAWVARLQAIAVAVNAASIEADRLADAVTRRNGEWTDDTRGV